MGVGGIQGGSSGFSVDGGAWHTPGELGEIAVRGGGGWELKGPISRPARWEGPVEEGMGEWWMRATMRSRPMIEVELSRQANATQHAETRTKVNGEGVAGGYWPY